MEKQAVITATDLCIGYRTHKEEKKVHEHLSFELYPGELTSLLGANGAGKIDVTSYIIRLTTLFSRRFTITGQTFTTLFGKRTLPYHWRGFDGQDPSRRIDRV